MNFDIFINIFWSIAYLLAIYFGKKYQKIYFPIILILLNISWELAACYNDIIDNHIIIIHFIWLILDFIILIQAFKYKVKSNLDRFIILIILFDITFAFIIMFKYYKLIYFTSILINVFMSSIFLFNHFKNKFGNSYFVDMFRLLGNVFVFINYYTYDNRLLVLLILTILFDLMAIFVALITQKRKLNIF